MSALTLTVALIREVRRAGYGEAIVSALRRQLSGSRPSTLTGRIRLV